MEESLHDVPLFREFAGLDNWATRRPDETTILRFRHLLKRHKRAEQILATVNDLLRDKGLMLRTGTVVDATLIFAPSSTKHSSGERDSEMHQTRKGNQGDFAATTLQKADWQPERFRALALRCLPRPKPHRSDLESALP